MGVLGGLRPPNTPIPSPKSGRFPLNFHNKTDLFRSRIYNIGLFNFESSHFTSGDRWKLNSLTEEVTNEQSIYLA